MTNLNDAVRDDTALPGLDDLLAGTMTFRDPERAHRAAQNMREPLNDGLAAVGELLWWASQHEDFPYDRKVIGDIGLLVKELAGITGTMADIEANATHQLNEQGDNADEFVSVPVIGKAN